MHTDTLAKRWENIERKTFNQRLSSWAKKELGIIRSPNMVKYNVNPRGVNKK